MVFHVLALHVLKVLADSDSDADFLDFYAAMLSHDSVQMFACHEALHARFDGQ